MTPTAITDAGRRIGKRASGGSGQTAGKGGQARSVRETGGERTTAPGRRRSVRPESSPRSPRRVSGPTGGRTATTARPKTTARSATTARPKTTARSATTARPKTTSRPKTQVRPKTTSRPRTSPRWPASPRSGRIGTLTLPWPRRHSGAARPVREGSLSERVVAAIRALPDHPWLDRVVRGRAWIAVLGVMLAGIVAMQVEVLKLGATMGRAIEQTTALQSRNELLRASVTSLADDQRIERLAAREGMVMPAPEDVGFLSAQRGDAARAAGHIRVPDAPAFLSLLTSSGGIATTPVPPNIVGSTDSSGTPTQPTTSAPGPASATGTNGG